MNPEFLVAQLYYICESSFVTTANLEMLSPKQQIEASIEKTVMGWTDRHLLAHSHSPEARLISV